MSFQDASTSQQTQPAYPIAPGGYVPSVTETSQVGPQAGSSATSTSGPPQSRQAAEEARKDRTLAEFMLMLDDYEPLVRSCLVWLQRDSLWSELLYNLDSKWSYRLLPPAGGVRLRRCSLVSYLRDESVLHDSGDVHLTSFSIENVCCRLLPRSLFQT